MIPASPDHRQDGFHDRNDRAFDLGQVHLAVEEAKARGVTLVETPSMPLDYRDEMKRQVEADKKS